MTPPPHPPRPPRRPAADNRPRPDRPPPKRPRAGGPPGVPARRPRPARPAPAPFPPAAAEQPFDTTPDAPPDAAPRETWLKGGIRVLHEDDDLIVVDKPAGIPTVTPPGQKAANVFDEVKGHVRDKVRRRGTRVWVIHRLDKEASGLLVFAKTERAFRWLKEEFRARRVHRLYSVVVAGDFPAPHDGQPASGTIQSFLYEDGAGRVRSVPSPMHVPRGALGAEGEETDPARLAVTHWQVVRAGSGRTALRVRLETGRKHQIRAHLASINHPIVGDRRYGSTEDPLSRVCLHAYELGFAHPSNGQSVRFLSPTPGSFFGLVGPDAPRAKTPPPTPESTPDPAAPTTTPPSPSPAPRTTDTDSWDHVAGWYDDLLGARGSDHHREVIIPGTLRLLSPQPGSRILDVACGQGILCRALADLGAHAVGVDASPRLIESARRQGGPPDATPEYHVGDARHLPDALPHDFDAACCVMALMNIDPLAPVAEGIASHLRPGGVFVGVILHPAFRAPGQTSWGWDDPRAASSAAPSPAPRARPAKPPAKFPPKFPARPAPIRQYRRVDGYLSPGQRPIVMNPGAAAHGAPPITTITYHRPIQSYVRAFADAGLLLEALEEWPSLRVSAPGPRAAEENRARREIPLFLAFKFVRMKASDRAAP
jgi:RluA family pseudouridine synthase